jgi:CHAD domain-containing protein
MDSEATQYAVANFRERLTRFRRQLARYIKNPDDDAIHDVRTSFRRLESADQTLSQSCKNEESKQTVSNH